MAQITYDDIKPGSTVWYQDDRLLVIFVEAIPNSTEGIRDGDKHAIHCRSMVTKREWSFRPSEVSIRCKTAGCKDISQVGVTACTAHLSAFGV